MNTGAVTKGNPNQDIEMFRDAIYLTLTGTYEFKSHLYKDQIKLISYQQDLNEQTVLTEQMPVAFFKVENQHCHGLLFSCFFEVTLGSGNVVVQWFMRTAETENPLSVLSNSEYSSQHRYFEYDESVIATGKHIPIKTKYSNYNNSVTRMSITGVEREQKKLDLKDS